jgi:hypothetical protein
MGFEQSDYQTEEWHKKVPIQIVWTKTYTKIDLNKYYPKDDSESVEDLIWVNLKENKERSTTTTTCYDVIHEWSKTGELQKLSSTAKTMLMTSKRSYGLFEKVSWGNFPDEQLITKNIQAENAQRTVSLMLPGPTYENNDLITWLARVFIFILLSDR